ncbi:MAG: hypothetical protein ACFB0A_12625 [Croceivirga sp.]
MEVPGEDGLVWVMMNRGNVNFMFQTFESLGSKLPEFSRQNGGSLLPYVEMNEIKKFHDEVAKEMKILKGMEKTFYGATEFSILNNSSYVLTFA